MKALLIFLFTLSSAQAACELNFPRTNLCADLTWTQGPVLNQASSFILKFDKSFAPYTLKVDLWMSMGGHGHGTRPLVMRSLGDESFEFTQAFMVMRGTWQVRAFLINGAGGEVERAVREVRL